MLGDLERQRECRHHQFGISGSRQPGEVDAVGKVVAGAVRELERESRFTGTARPRERDEPNFGPRDQSLQLAELAPSADEGSWRCG